MTYSAQVPTRHGSLRNWRMRRMVLREDLGTATLYAHYFHSHGSLTIQGSTALGVSTAVLRSLKRTGGGRARAHRRGEPRLPRGADQGAEASAARDKALRELLDAQNNVDWAVEQSNMGNIPRTPEPASPAPESSVCPPPCASQSSTSGEQLVSGGASVSSSFFQGVWPD